MRNLQALIEQQQSEIFKLQSLIDVIPAYVYCKNKEGVYLWCNDAGVKSFGLISSEAIIGKTDFDLRLEWGSDAFAKKVRKNDLRILESGKQETIEEEVIINSVNKVYVAQKAPFRNNEGEVIGILGVSINVTAAKDAKDNNAHKNTVRDFDESNQAIKIIHKDTGAHVSLPLYLSTCLQQILKGKTAKQIGLDLALSPRTVEHYTVRLKNLLGCSSCKELIYLYSS